MWLLTIVHDELCYENRFLQIRHPILLSIFPTLFLVSIFNGCPSLYGSSWNKLYTSEHRVHCSFLLESARVWGCSVIEQCEALGTSFVSPRTINKFSMESLHGFNPRFLHTTDQTHLLSIDAVKSRESTRNNATDESLSVCWSFWRFASFSTLAPSPFLVFHVLSMFCTVVQCVSLLEN